MEEERNNMSIKPKFLATAIGSLPHSDPAVAVDVILKNIPDAPIWPQLPSTGLTEQMEIQYSEGMPSAVIEQDKRRMYFDTASDSSEAFANFYEQYMAAMDPDEGTGDCSAMAITPAFSKGIYAMEKCLQAKGGKIPFVKVQTTGPCSFALTLVDENKRAIYYNDEFRDMIVKALAQKCRWQIQKFQPFAENVICFIDEPILSAFGSSTYVSVQRADVVALLKEVIDAVHADKGIAGIHCCGNTEWSILIDAGVDIVNFDAFGYADTIAMYGSSVKQHLQRGGMLAWGVVPTSAAIREQTVETLVAKFEQGVDNLVAKAGIDKQLILEQAIITPSCGTGSLPVPDAERVFDLLGKTSHALKAKYKF
jgi:methionine synthase II (cobalamin-independent)